MRLGVGTPYESITCNLEMHRLGKECSEKSVGKQIRNQGKGRKMIYCFDVGKSNRSYQ